MTELYKHDTATMASQFLPTRDYRTYKYRIYIVKYILISHKSVLDTSVLMQ